MDVSIDTVAVLPDAVFAIVRDRRRWANPDSGRLHLGFERLRAQPGGWVGMMARTPSSQSSPCGYQVAAAPSATDGASGVVRNGWAAASTSGRGNGVSTLPM